MDHVADQPTSRPTTPRTAWRFIILLGIVSLFADMTYEGARSVTGPYLAVLGASATVVGIVAGFGELLGYGLRLVSGLISDRTGRYWPVTFFGYFLNLLAVPALALTGRWEIAALLMIIERIGKATRNPARDAMLSHASSEIGQGRGFGFHEAMDQTGAVVGPLIVAGVLAWKSDYKLGFAVLLIPALLALATLTLARFQYPHPSDLEAAPSALDTHALPRIFWVYVLGAGLIAAGYADFPLIAYHFQKTSLLAAHTIPIYFAVAMGLDALAALIFGQLYDRIGMKVIVGIFFVSAWFAPFVFYGGAGWALLGVVLWGIGMGAQESVMRAAVAGMAASDRRATAYGMFDTGFGVFWFAGSVLLGILYDVSLPTLVIFSVAVQLIALPVLLRVVRVRQASGQTA